MNYFLVGFFIAAIIAGITYWLKSRADSRSESGDDQSILSFVALLLEPGYMEPLIIAKAAERAWGADIGVERSGKDGFVVGSDHSSVIRFRGRDILVNNFNSPYVEDPVDAAQSITDLRLREYFGQHTAWLSVDALGAEFKSEKEIRDWYRLLAPLFCELVDDNCLAIFLPLTEQLFANMDETLEKLRSDDPLKALEEESYVPVIQVADDDPRMIAAVNKAREEWPKFQSALESKRGENFSVKAPISGGGNTEFIWLQVTAVENGVIYGELANDPINLGSLRLGSRVKTPVSELNDWCYLDDKGEPVGLFTVKVVQQAAEEHRQTLDEQ